MDRKLIIVTIIALVLELGILFGDFWSGQIGFLNRHHAKSNGQALGLIADTKQNVRRKRQRSLIWEKSEQQDSVFEYDSILTLKQSSASLKLEPGVDLNLSENTLVVLEPADLGKDSQDRSLRLRFSSGQIRADAQGRDLAITAKEWTLSATKGTELNLRQLSNGEMQFEIEKGEVDLQNSENHEALKGPQRLTLDDKKITLKQAIRQDLKWSNQNHQRIYSHHFPFGYKLAWTGNAEALEVAQPGQSPQMIALDNDQKQISLPMLPGTFTFTLHHGSDVSPSLTTQFYQSPWIQTYSPLPRDRVLTKQASVFSWTPVAPAKKYRVEFSRRADFKEIILQKEISSSSFNAQIDKVGAYYWRVLGIDDQGFIIPSEDAVPIFLIQKPFPQPLLHQPQLQRLPATHSPGAERECVDCLRWIFHLLVPEAKAVDIEKPFYNSEFSWDSVEGATKYVIEISDTPTFRKTLVNEVVNEPRFVWKQMHLGRYYWRVAAASEDQDGLFSDVSLADLTDEKAAELSGVTLSESEVEPPPIPTPLPTATPAPVPSPTPFLKKKPLQKPKPSPSPSPAPTPMPVAPQPTPSPTPLMAPTPPPVLKKPMARPRAKPLSLPQYIWIGGGFVSNDVIGEQNLKAKLAGSGTLRFGVEFAKAIKSNSLWQLGIVQSSTTWRITDSQNPFQQDLKDSRLKGYGLFGNNPLKWSYGIQIQQTNVPIRQGFETITLEKHTLLGPVGRWQFQFSQSPRLSSISQLQILTGDQIYALELEQQFRIDFTKWHLFSGVQAEASYLSGPFGTATEGYGGVILGLTW